MNAHRTHDVALAPSYRIHIGSGVRHRIPDALRQLCRGHQLRLVSDDTVYSLYGAELCHGLKAAGFDVAVDVVAAGEESKSVATWQHLLERWASEGLHRDDLAVALGGGVIGDLTGFAAATYARGIPFVQIPTTLLAAVDASVGGKTAINLQAGKNLAGAFWQPSAVFFDPDYLNTLSAHAVEDGLAEMIKMAVLTDAELLNRLASHLSSGAHIPPTDLIERSILHKAAFVEADERDKGRRQQLNLGHTIGHAIERLSAFTISHGHAVAMGMAAICRMASVQGTLNKADASHIIETLALAHLPTDLPFDAPALAAAMENDKKSHAAGITFVVPERIGRCRLQTVPYAALADFIASGGST